VRINAQFVHRSTNRPGEGCAGYLRAEGAYGGSLPGSASVKKVRIGTNPIVTLERKKATDYGRKPGISG
jgi:hypothetical protein